MKIASSNYSRALVLGLALLSLASAPVSAEIVRIVARCSGTGGAGVGNVRYAFFNSAIDLEWTYDTANLQANSIGGPNPVAYLGSNWLTLTVKTGSTVLGVIDASSEGYASAASSAGDGDSLFLRKGPPFSTLTGSYAELNVILASYRSLFPTGTPQLPPATWTASPGDITNFTVSAGTVDASGTVLSAVSVSGTVLSITVSSPPSSPADLLEALSDTLGGMSLDTGTANSLDAKLASALAAQLDPKRKDNKTTINILNAFINSVEAQRGKKLTQAQADELVRLARALIVVLSA